MNIDKIPLSVQMRDWSKLNRPSDCESYADAVAELEQKLIPPAIDFHQEAEDLFLRLDRIYAAVDSIDEIEKTLRRIVNASHHC